MTRSRIVVAAAVLSALLGACADDSSDGGGTTTTAAGGDGTVTGIDQVTTTTAGPGAEVAVRALAAAGTWTGTWTNDTFNSTGPISLVLTVDEDAETADAVLDLGGNVFGAADPDEEMFSIPLFPGTHRGSSPTFGSYAVTLTTGTTINVVATEMPAIPTGTFTMDGELINDNFSGTYSVDFGDGRDSASGRFELIKQPAAPATTAP